MGEIGKLLQEDLKDIQKKYPRASGQKKLRPAYYIWVILPIITFYIWQYYAVQGPKQPEIKNIQTTKINEIVQATNARMTEQKLMVELAKQLTPENVKRNVFTETPQVKNTLFPTEVKNYDVLETGLKPDEVMTVLQNLPAPGRYRSDNQNEAVVSTRDFKISFYFPPYGGINCWSKYNCSYTASGLRVMEGVGYYAACPPEYEFGTKLIIFNKEWVCQDRGSAIINDWLDLLYPYQPYGLYWSQPVTVKIIGKVNNYATITTTPIPEYPTITKTNVPEEYPTITKTPERTATSIPTGTSSPTISNTHTNTPTKTEIIDISTLEITPTNNP